MCDGTRLDGVIHLEAQDKKIQARKQVKGRDGMGWGADGMLMLEAR